MASTISPEQEEGKNALPSEDVPDFLRRREDLYNPDAKDNHPSGDASDPRTEDKASPEDLSKAEKQADKPGAHENTVGAGYKAGAGEHHSKWHSRFTRTRKRKAAIGGSLAALLVGGAIIAFLSLIPLKILHIVNNLQSRFYATTQNAVEKETDQLFSRYVLGKMLNGCRGVYIDQNCNPYNGTSLVNKLYRGWSDGRLEEKLRTQTGLEIRKNTLSEGYELRFTGGDTIDLEGLKQNKTISQLIDAKGEWSSVKKSEVRGIYKSALKATTRQASAMYYFKVTPYLGKKFGIKWCVIGCDKREGFDKWGADKKFGAKMWLAERVLGPRAELYKMIMTCLYNGSDFCSKDKVLNATPKEYSSDAGGCKIGCVDNGRAVSSSLNDMETKLVALAAQYGSDHDNLRKAFDRFEKLGFTRSMFQSLASNNRIDDEGNAKGDSRLGERAEQVARVSSKAVPIIGWVITASYAAVFIDDAPETIARLQYMTNTAAMAQLWGMYRTAADEVKEGQTDAELLGSFVTSLGPGLQPTESDEQQIGGTSGAEATPLYQEVVSGGPNTNAGIASLVHSVFSTSASAQTADDGYKCANGQPPPAGQLVCAEEKLNDIGPLGEALSNVQLGMITDAARFLTNTLDSLIGGVVNAVCSLLGPICGLLTNAINELVSGVLRFEPLREILQKFAEWMLGINLHMVSNNMSGGRTFDMMAAGADVSGNDYAHHGIGGVALTAQQVADNLNYSRNEQLAEYKQQSLIAQLTDTDSPYSPVAKLALAMPSSTTALFTGINNAWSSFVMNPFGKLANSFASIFTLRTQAAGFIPGKDPFGVTQYGYPLDDPIFQQDPDTYWQNYCTDENYNLTNDWNKYAAENLNPETYEPENTQTARFAGSVPGNRYGTNGCLLIQAAVGSAGAIFTDGVLSAEELASSNAGAGGGGGPLDCNSTGGPDQSPGNAGQTNGHADLIAASAPGMTCPDYPKPDGAIPSDPGRQYFAYDGCSDGCQDQGRESCQANNAGTACIKVKYRDPPGSGNTIYLCIGGCGN